MILILTNLKEDGNAEAVAAKLRERGAEHAVFDYSQYPSQAEISVSYQAGGAARHVLHTPEGAINLDDVTTAWLRRPSAVKAHAEIENGPTHKFVEGECRTFLRDLWDSLRWFWVPAAPAVVDRTQLKAAQLRLAGELGFELPPTLITNHAEDLLEFYREHNGSIVSKLAGIGFSFTLGQTFCRYTERVSKRDLGYARAIRFCPMIFQAYVPKRVELRITVVGQRVFAAEIHSQHTHHTRHDWRRYDLDATPHFTHELPPEVEQRCIRLLQKMGLSYGAIDMILTPDGRYVFIEINPSGQYMWIEQITGLPITDAICDLLISGKTTEAIPSEPLAVASPSSL